MAIVETTSQQSDSKNQLVQPSHNTTEPKMELEPLDFDECLKDSPRFRQSLKDNLNSIENLENCMTKTIKQITNYIETGQDHIKAQKNFISSMKVLNSSLGANKVDISKRISTLLDTLEEIMGLHEIVIDQSARTIGTSLTNFINDDLIKIKEARKGFDKISYEYDQALHRYSQPVKKQQDDSENLLIATSTAFTHTSLDLSIQLTTLQSKKGYDILSSLLSFTKAHSTFFHQGSDLFEDLKPHISEMDQFISNVQDEFETLVRTLPCKHLMVSNNELKPLCFDIKAQQVHLEGYLFKRASNGFKVWNRRWFILKDHQLLYQKRGEAQPNVMEEDLRLLTVRPVDRTDCDRRFCFEVLSPHKSHILQADSEASCKTWISALQAGINAAFHDTEYKMMPKSTSANEVCTGTSSWSSSFSFKALQQQATSRLNSIATLSETKEITKGQVKDGSQINKGASVDGDEENSDRLTRTDEQGRLYAPLRDDDDVDDDGEDDVDGKARVVKKESTNYPAPALTIPVEPPVKPQRAYMIILAMPGNDKCADCGASQPKWASINLGITLCIECAGIHRSLGVHLSKVRSLTLDTEVWSPEVVQLMLSLGNTSVNSAYLSCYRNQLPPIEADSNREQREAWIKSKYLLKSFMQPSENDKIESLKPKDDGTTSTESSSNKSSTKNMVSEQLGQTESNSVSSSPTNSSSTINTTEEIAASSSSERLSQMQSCHQLE